MAGKVGHSGGFSIHPLHPNPPPPHLLLTLTTLLEGVGGSTFKGRYPSGSLVLEPLPNRPKLTLGRGEERGTTEASLSHNTQQERGKNGISRLDRQRLMP